MIRVGIDVSPLRQTRAGTARHIEGLLGGLEREADVELRRFAGPARGRAGVLATDVAWYPLALPLAARRAGVHVLHCPTFRGPAASPVPLVVTVHDLAVLRHPDAFNRWTRSYSRVAVPRVVGAAARVISVSEFTRRELVDVLGTADDKIRVVPNAIGPEFTAEGPAEDGDYALAVGTLEPRKNLLRAVEAARLAGVELRVVGARGWGDVPIGGAHVRWLGDAPDERLAELYRGARCLVYASVYEGFGIPVLEAMACGTPVVTSSGTGTEEVAGGAAVLVDPHDTRSIAAGIREALERRDELVARGRARAAEFSWTRAAAETAAVYRELA